MKLKSRTNDSQHLGLLNVAMERLELLHENYNALVPQAPEPIGFLDHTTNQRQRDLYKENILDVAEPMKKALVNVSINYRTMYMETFNRYLNSLGKKNGWFVKSSFRYNEDFNAMIVSIAIDHVLYNFNVKYEK